MQQCKLALRHPPAERGSTKGELCLLDPCCSPETQEQGLQQLVVVVLDRSGFELLAHQGEAGQGQAVDPKDQRALQG